MSEPETCQTCKHRKCRATDEPCRTCQEKSERLYRDRVLYVRDQHAQDAWDEAIRRREDIRAAKAAGRAAGKRGKG